MTQKWGWAGGQDVTQVTVGKKEDRTAEKCLKSTKLSRGAIINPTLIVEVLSDETREYDKGDKFDGYCIGCEIRLADIYRVLEALRDQE